MKKYYGGNQLSLLLRKGVYPNDYVDCLKKIGETCLPPKEPFYSKRTGEGITNEDNNEYVGTEFDPAEESKFISYFDANNLMVGQCQNNFKHLNLSV